MADLWGALMDALPGDWEIFKRWSTWRFLLDGLWFAIRIAIQAIILSLLVGVVMSVARLAPSRPIRWLAATYVEVLRATPLLLLLFFVFFGSARTDYGLSAERSAVLALTLYNSAVVAEIMRAGILSISKGIIEASRALGMSYLQSMRYIGVPMALRRMSPGLVSQLITLFKDTSLAAIIGVLELLRSGRILFDSVAFGNPTVEVLVVISVMYFIPSYALSLVAQRLEQGPEARAGREQGVVVVATGAGPEALPPPED